MRVEPAFADRASKMPSPEQAAEDLNFPTSGLTAGFKALGSSLWFIEFKNFRLILGVSVYGHDTRPFCALPAPMS